MSLKINREDGLARPQFLPVLLFYVDLTLHRLYVFITNIISDVTEHSVLTGWELKMDIKCSLYLQ